MANATLPTYKPKDFASDQDVRWCPGCGDYAVLNAVKKVLPTLGRRKEDFVFVSGIGCAARFPYYVDTYGLHSIHGRAPALATGVKVANPELDVWIVSGDGDLLSIGGNHTIHAMRRNVDLNIILLNNRIYGLTKGQYSPTSEFGKRTKSTPVGSLDFPINPLALAIGAGCTFVARCLDIDTKHLEHLMALAAGHRGTAFIEVYQDCNIFNHGSFFYASRKDTKQDNTITLEHEKPLIFGHDRDRGIVMRGTRLEAVKIGQDGVTENDLVIHDETDRGLAFLLAQMKHPDMPEAMGLLYRDDTLETYGDLVRQQIDHAVETHARADIAALLREGDTWTIED
jgi:2-oxoglutarate ferredoxin oxidoreductase subunit beta